MGHGPTARAARRVNSACSIRETDPVEATASYTAPRWLPGGHLQTLYAALVAPRPQVSYRRERWETPDGDFVEVDWLEDVPSAIDRRSLTPTPLPRGEGLASPTPLVALFHGLEGGSGSHYARALMWEAAAHGWRAAVVHFRGCGGTENRLPRAYHSGDTAELDWMLRELRARHTGPVYAAGVSLGGNVLLKWLGERSGSAAELVSAAAAVSAPVDLTAAGDTLGRGFNLVYTRAFLATLRRKSLQKLEKHPGLYDPSLVRRARTLRAFDNVVTAPLHGFLDADDYWTRASSKPLLSNIRVPTLMLNARNDPFLPASALPRAHEVSASVTLEYPEEGGHVGFVAGAFPGNLRWLPRRLLTFFRHRHC